MISSPASFSSGKNGPGLTQGQVPQHRLSTGLSGPSHSLLNLPTFFSYQLLWPYRKEKLLSKSVHVSWDRPQGSPWNGHSFLKSLSIHFHTPREVGFLFGCNPCSLSGSEDERKNTEMTIPFARYSGNTLYPHDLELDGSHYTDKCTILRKFVPFICV